MSIAQTFMGLGINPLVSLHLNAGTVDSSEACAGTTQAGATMLSLRGVHWIKTGAGNAGVVIPPGASNTTANALTAGDYMVIVNATGNTIKLYPPGTGAFNGGSASASVSLTNNQVCFALCLDGGANANFATLIV